METVPDTGGGLSGFIANLLWQIYRYFPYAHAWDWLLLFSALALLGVALFWPYLWKAVAADMRLLQNREYEISSQEVALFWWGQVWQWFLIWFFYTDAGKTLLVGRQWFDTVPLSEVNRTLFWISLGVHFGLMLFFGWVVNAVCEWTERRATGRPKPFRERTLLALFNGGGTFYSHKKDGSAELEVTGIPIAIFSVVSFVAHVVYWYWSAASLLLMMTVTCAIMLNEVVRMTFVYILHRRTFG